MAGTGFWALRPRLSETGRKVRNVICIVYLEDLAKYGKTYGDLLGYLDHMHVKAVVSPVHDKDCFTSQDVIDWCTRHLDKETGDLAENSIERAPYVGKPKKKHCHVGLISRSQRTAEEWTEFMSGLLYIRPSMWDKLEDYDSFVRYCAHLDSPEKAHYSAFDVVALGGADLSCLLKYDEHERISNLTEIFKFSRDHDIRYFHTLVDAALNSGDMDWIGTVRGNATLFANYYNSKRNKRSDDAARKKAKEESQGTEV